MSNYVNLKADCRLDVGRGSGQLLFHLRNRRTKQIGLEYSGQRLAHAQVDLAKLPLVAIQGTMGTPSDIATASMECAVPADTSEYVPDACLVAGSQWFYSLHNDCLMGTAFYLYLPDLLNRAVKRAT